VYRPVQPPVHLRQNKVKRLSSASDIINKGLGNFARQKRGLFCIAGWVLRLFAVAKRVCIRNRSTKSLECKREHKSAGFVAARSGAPNAKGASASSNGDTACAAVRSLTGVDRWVAFGVIADNLINMGRVM
jgi:hypothetical protein